ncbi:pseudouridine kinase [Alteribacillus persepolensis]|uniref:Pseudouridine kinase n=1 Tax=Alteribacillus persepolensis TaxID=568899 RepID=A0A1G8EGI3_9BACI|nr:carbohydrate kinase [Alteribacillus persepolensis]SDH68890.1 pseudouridine kinase [Alteribacillus persepolensis]
MNEKEKLLLELVRKNPYISQNELADALQLSRSAVAGYISSLTKKGKIIGRAYVLPDNGRITCIGGANVDRKSQLKSSLQYGTSNPVTVSQTCGGVARNIAENLGRLDAAASLLTVVGNDQEGEWLLEMTQPYANTSQTMRIPQMNTGTYTAVLNDKGEMLLALSDMEICEAADQAFIDKHWNHIASSSIVLLDTNFPDDVLKMVIERCNQENIPLCIAPVSAPKIKKLPADLSGITWFIVNVDEAMALTGAASGNLREASGRIIDRGVKNVIITRGEKGIFYKTERGEEGAIPAPKTNVVDVTGAGDSFISGFLYGMNKGASFKEACKTGMACSMITLQTKETVHTKLHVDVLDDTYNRFFAEEETEK